ncbi:hypothetical protein H6F67_00150 [Microcoleus sp. FACHB-1515]|uniref:hypothetical protein n=1 Tax=Cyanophyceae TaxID=3028117 RepID=UPI00168858B6|nr:hypothetical protein [Microcoleus sp. FACHB-1515]MBD2088286.1 hypothetical protein [Microcoleus sp. FACHB-1515]
MKFKYFWVSLAAGFALTLIWLLVSLPAASQTAVRLQTSPPLSQVVPNTEPVQLTVQAIDVNQQPIADANIQVRLLTPPKTPWFTSDFPIVEGTTLLELGAIAPAGKLQFEQVLPIRGTYRLEANVTPQTAGAFEPFEQILTLAVSENSVKYRNVGILITILLLTGFGGGWVIGGDQTAREGEIAPQPVRMLLSAATLLAIVVLLTVNITAEIAEARSPHHSAAASADPAIAQAQGIRVELLGDRQATVGQTATQTILVTDTTTQEPIANTAVNLQAIALEHNERVFTFAGVTDQSGKLTWQQQFFNGAPHQVSATIAPETNSSRQFAPIQVAHEVEVEGIAPPLTIRLISLIYFTAIFVVGLIAGFLGHRRFQARSIA